MASDRTRERVEEFMYRAGLGDVSFGCADLCDCERCKRAWTALLDAFEREMKINEAKTIEELFDRCTDTRQFAGTLDRHIFDLAAQPTPEVKK